mgnify:FL=1
MSLNKKKIKSMTNSQKNQLVEKAKQLKDNDCEWILEQIIDHNITFTENKNGCFIKIIDIDNDLLLVINNYINNKLDEYAKEEKQFVMPETVDATESITGLDSLDLNNYEKSLLKKSKYMVGQKIIKKENQYYKQTQNI